MKSIFKLKSAISVAALLMISTSLPAFADHQFRTVVVKLDFKKTVRGGDQGNNAAVPVTGTIRILNQTVSTSGNGNYTHGVEYVFNEPGPYNITIAPNDPDCDPSQSHRFHEHIPRQEEGKPMVVIGVGGHFICGK